MKNLLIIIIVLWRIFPLHAEDNFQHKGLGISGGYISGSGFSYRQMNEKLGFQITFGLLSLKNGNGADNYARTETYYPDSGFPQLNQIYTEYSSGRETWANMGLTLYKPIHRSQKSLFYLLAGISNYSSFKTEYQQSYKYTLISDSMYSYAPTGDERKTTSNDNTIHAGIGLGIEFQIWDNIRMFFDWPLSFSSNGDINMFIPQGGLHYFFK